MKRETFRLTAGAVLVLAACAPKPGDGEGGTAAPFTSDRISVITQGSGPDLILIPGLVSHRSVWDSVAVMLDDRYRLHLVQLNGFAGLPAAGNAEGPVSAPAAEEIARYISETKLAKPAVIGHSMGGTIGLMLAARHPDLVGRLMVVDMPPFMGEMFGPPGTTSDSVRRIADSLRAGMLAATRDSFVTTLGQMIATMTRKEGLRPGLVESVRGSDQRTAANAMHELIVTDLRPELPRITAPVVVLYVMPPNVPLTPAQFDALMQRSYAGVPSVRLVKVEDSFHFIQFDQPARVVAEVDALMRQ